MAEKFYGLIPQEEWLDVGFQVNRPNDPLDGLVGDLRTNNIIAKWQSIAAEYQTSIMAQFHAFDTESQKTIRVPVDAHNIKKALIKVKIDQSELLQEYIDNGVQGDQELKDYILNDGIRLAEQVFTRSKVAKAEMLATGKITIKKNTLALPVDYGVPASHISFELDLSPEADISSQIQDIIDAADDVGVKLTGFITSRKNITKMRRNAALQKEINGNLGAGVLIGQSALRAHLEEEYGLGRIVTHDLTYGADAKIGSDGRPAITRKRYFPDNKISFFAANPAGYVGTGLWGDPPEVRLSGFYSVNASGVAPYVYVTQKMEWDPAVLWTKASGLFMPLLYDPNSLWIATVKDNSSSAALAAEEPPAEEPPAEEPGQKTRTK